MKHTLGWQGNVVAVSHVTGMGQVRKVKLKFSLQQVMKTQRGSGDIALLFL
jgi:hypothetical protein